MTSFTPAVSSHDAAPGVYVAEWRDAPMNEQKFSTRQALSLATMSLIGHVIVLFNGSPAGNDFWLSILLAYTATLPLALMYARLITIFPGKNMFDLQIYIFGPVFGRIFILLYSLFFLHVGSLVLRGITAFIQITSLTETPQIISAVLIGLLCIYAIKAGINTLSRYTAMAMPAYILIIFGLALLATTLWRDLSHLGPVLYNGFKPVLKSAVVLSIVPFADGAILPFILQPLKDYRKAKAIFLWSYTITAVFFLIVSVQYTLVLGNNFTFTLYFPSYVMVSLISIGDFLERIEVIMGAVLFMGAFVKIAVFLYNFSLGVSKLLNMGDYRKFSAPCGMLLIALSLLASPNILSDVVFVSTAYPYYAGFFDIVLPLAIWLPAEWKRKKLKDSGQLPEPPPAATETPVIRQDGGIPQNPDGPPEGRPQPT
jgi:spore germination protein KB